MLRIPTVAKPEMARALVTLEISSRLRKDGSWCALGARALESLEMTSFYRAGRRGEAFLQTLP